VCLFQLVAAYFFAWWSAWVIGSEYASRYSNVDFTHMVFWSLYGLMCANMLMHTNHGVQGPNAYGFCLSCAGIHAVSTRESFSISAQEQSAFSERKKSEKSHQRVWLR
jgi:hypothetical protein